MINLLRQRKFVYGTALAAGIFGLGVGQAVLQRHAEAQGSTVQAPVFEVDPLWPKPVWGHAAPRPGDAPAFARFIDAVRGRLGMPG